MTAETRTVARPFPVLTGLGGLLRGELVRWVGRRGIVQLVAWTIVIQGLLYWDTVATSDPLADWRGFDLLIHLWWIAGPLAAIGLAQNALVEERHRQTAPWVLSKPVSRSSFVVSKVISDSVGLIALAVVLQAAIAWVWLPRVDPGTGLTIQRPESDRYLVVIAVFALVILFFVSMTVFLTTVLPWRGPAAGIGLVTWIFMWNAPFDVVERFTIGGLVSGEIQGATMKPIAEYLVFGTSLEPTSGVLWTGVAAIAFVGAAVAVFRREEF